MVIRGSDRLADVLARDDRMLEMILAAVPDLRGLRNPMTRRVMGRLVTVAQAARMAGIEPDLLLRRVNAALALEKEESKAGELEAAGRETDPSASASDQEMEVNDSTAAIPAFLAHLDPDRANDLDVREDLRNGREPFSRIMAARAALPSGGVLRLRATFEPVPLYAVMAKQGFEHWTEQLADDDWRVWFYPRELSAAGREADSQTPAEAGRSEIPAAVTGRAQRGGNEGADVVILDVRGLDPPEPMVRTLAALESLERGKTLLQINERVPQFLIPRLEELGFVYDVREQAEGVVRVFIRHAAQD